MQQIKCQSKIVAVAEKVIVKCSEGGLTQLKTKCKERFFASVLFAKEGSTIVKSTINKTGNVQEDFLSSDDDLMMQLILTVEATVFYNKKRNVVAVARKDE